MKTWNVLSILVLAAFGSAVAQPRYDILIRGGRVLDGSGNPWFTNDVAIENGRIAAVGRLDGASADRVIDAEGLYVSPGFIDMHSHANSGFDHEERRAKATVNNLMQGITTVVFSEGSAWGQDERIQDKSGQWSSSGIGTNAAMFVGISNVRREVMQDPEGTPTEPEMEEMKRLVRQAMDGGAYGIATAPDYWPGHFITTEEIIELGKVVASYGGIFAAHMRSEGLRSIWWVESDPSPRVTLLDAVREMIHISKAAEIPVHIGHIKSTGVPFWGMSREACALIEKARAEGVPVTADQYPYISSGPDGNTQLFKWQPYLRESIPFGAEDRSAKIRELKDRIRARMDEDATFASQVEKDVYHEILARGGADRMFVSEYEERPAYVGKTLAELAELRDESLYATARYLQLEHDARIRSYSMSEEDIHYYLTRDYITVATDGSGLPGRHPRSYGTFPRVMRKYVLDEEVITLPFFIRKSTSLPAAIMGWDDRGWIKKDYRADILIFDLETIRDRATFDEMDLYSEGMRYVVIGGKLVIDEGQYTGELPGEVIGKAKPSI